MKAPQACLALVLAVAFSAVLSGVKELREVLKAAEDRRRGFSQRLVVVIVLLGIFLHRRVVKPQKHDMLRVRRPAVGFLIAVENLFFVHPVRFAIEDGAAAVAGQSLFRLRGHIHHK